MLEVNDDPIRDIRRAINNAFADHRGPPDHKVIIDRAIDNLPDFFRRPLTAAGNAVLRPLNAAAVAYLDACGKTYDQK